MTWHIFKISMSELTNLKKDLRAVADPKRAELKKELGDVLWYMAQLATKLGLSFNDIAVSNSRKLKSRMKRGKLKGSGDDR